jgi:hypothetical protein
MGSGYELKRRAPTSVLKARPNGHEAPVRRRSFDIGVPDVSLARVALYDSCAPQFDVFTEKRSQQLDERGQPGNLIEEPVTNREVLPPFLPPFCLWRRYSQPVVL